MDFFEHQDRARKKTSLLVFYYGLAVALIAVAVYAAFATLFLVGKAKSGETVDIAQAWNPELFLWVVGGTLAVVATGTVIKIAQLKGGGEAVARMLGGRVINRNTTDPDERKVLNVVEEMAIAAGLPVPPVFLLEQEDAINAFAAGFNPGDAVIGVTRGCVRQLTRDELQGVIAHEFSHILNGDMRLNIRLIGVLNGILIIALIGYGIMRGAAHSRPRRSRDKGGGQAAILVLGILLMIIGYVGVFFGKLIKSAVSRQREFLADASAVQFTRNPDGIAGALSKIGGFARGSRLRTAKAEEASHFFFSNGLARSFTDLLSTHPPLEERIRRIDASYVEGAPGAAPSPAAATGRTAPAAAAAVSGFAVDAGNVVASVGAPSVEHLAYATDLLARLPGAVSEAARAPSSAAATVYALLLDDNADVRAAQVQRLTEQAGDAVAERTADLAPQLAKAGRETWLPVLDLSLSALRQLTPAQFAAFKENVDALVRADREVDLFEFALQRMILRHLDPAFGKVRRAAARHKTVAAVASPCAALLSCLAYWGTDSEDSARDAFAKGRSRFEAGALDMLPVDRCGLQTVDDALATLEQASPLIKRRVIDACTACIGADGWVTVEEAELLRAVADSLDCPIPPFLPGKTPGAG